jgi:ubiquinone/menaquinone biosynthesis C-methylase UbiE
MSMAQTAPQSVAPPAAPPIPDLAGLKARQHAAWSSGDYALVGSTLQIVGEELCEALDLRAGQRVLDIAAGNGNSSLAAARRWCEVTSTDYVPALLARGKARAAANGMSIAFQEADAEALPFADASFDAVVSTYGVMFTPDQDKAAAEMLRVCRPGGKIGLANWTPQGFIGQMFKTYYGPVLKAVAALDEDKRTALLADLQALIGRLNRAEDGTMVVPGEYLEVVIARK